jgi:hypothetical protein
MLDVIVAGVTGIIVASAQTTTSLAKQQAVSVPFVGCASSGRTKTVDAPKGTGRSVPISSMDAQVLAYYSSADGMALPANRKVISSKSFVAPNISRTN